MRTGPNNALTDVPGLRVGHASLAGRGVLSGTTVVVAPPDGAVAGVDLRGWTPGTRETDLLDPGRMVQRVHAVVLTGGSAYGLAAADGVMARLEAEGCGFTVPGGVVPIVPAAAICDLGRGGDRGVHPDGAAGAAAFDAASTGPVAQGSVGAGTGAVSGGLKGGVGTASTVLDGGAVVAALVVVDSAGSGVDPATGTLRGARAGLPGEFPDEAVDEAGRSALLAAAATPPTADPATTLAVVATDLALDKAGCARLAAMGHDGLTRSIPAGHMGSDACVVFGLSTSAGPAPGMLDLFVLHAVAADVVARAVAHALLAASTVSTDSGSWPAYGDLAIRAVSD
ncbi:P1 family peptidase [Pseudonocardia alaniniphila]|uniref:P1 family peptidase n=1 Tax=Pseudonocardia alaniniphila TaxID=75291 RepID=A0ABS9TM14_9PSEU|nr:P1 family peptidase [Pseudonocardia alaniniphila]MCH6169571.1 P1 family peptidase [Pseudonocardia alaniniphila]